MLYIVVRHEHPENYLKPDYETGWHIGEQNPFQHRHAEIERVIEVQADGDELAYIYNKFNNLPTMPLRRVVRWFGDHAKFIAANLDTK